MTRLHTIQNWAIESNKIDNCMPNWADAVTVGVLCSGIISLVLFLITMSLIALIVMFICGLLFIIPFFLQDCGIEITVRDLNADNNRIMATYTYKFSQYPDVDAENIQEIVDTCVERVNNYLKRNADAEKAKEDRSKQCCMRYQERIELIKNGK